MAFEPVVDLQAPPPSIADSESAVITVSFEAVGERTLLTERSTYPSREIRDQVLASGMEVGMQETWSALDALVVGMREGAR